MLGWLELQGVQINSSIRKVTNYSLFLKSKLFSSLKWRERSFSDNGFHFQWIGLQSNGSLLLPEPHHLRWTSLSRLHKAWDVLGSLCMSSSSIRAFKSNTQSSTSKSIMAFEKPWCLAINNHNLTLVCMRTSKCCTRQPQIFRPIEPLNLF